MSKRDCFEEHLNKILVKTKDKAAIIGIGNRMRGDDGAGPALIDSLKNALPEEKFPLFDCGETPENWIIPIINAKPQTIFIVDAVDFGVTPGSIKIFDPTELGPRGISTHSMSLDIFVNYLKKELGASIFLIGIQPKSLKFGGKISNPVSKAIDRLTEYFRHLGRINPTPTL